MIFCAGLVDQIADGLNYCLPIDNILPINSQEAYVSLAYISLIPSSFEGTKLSCVSLWK